MKQKILVVEDVKIAQQLAKMMLISLGCEVDVAENGSQTLEQYNQKNYDLIFMDIGLPDIDGFSVTETIRKQEKEHGRYSTPIIVLTAHSNETFKQRAVEVGADDFMVKPLTMSTAEITLKKYLSTPVAIF